MNLDLTDWRNRKWQTRDGRPVRLLCVDAPDSNYPIYGFVGVDVFRWKLDGSYPLQAKDKDLIPVPPPKRKWKVYVCERMGLINFFSAPSEGDTLLATAEITEGDGLEGGGR